MQDFDYMTPTRLIFGNGAVDKLADAIRPYGKHVLLAYGGGSIKKSGLYDKVKALLADFEIFELSGIQPNPKYDPSVLEGVRLCKENNIDIVLAVGGGSVLDCCKAIAAGAKYDGDVWDLVIGAKPTLDALHPLGKDAFSLRQVRRKRVRNRRDAATARNRGKGDTGDTRLLPVDRNPYDAPRSRHRRKPHRRDGAPRRRDCWS